MNREEFFTALAGFDEDGLRKMVWTLYWRGSAPVRHRIEALLDPADQESTGGRGRQPVNAKTLLDEVRDFVGLARSGAYMAGNRRVSPKERSRWRMTFRRLAKAAQDALGSDEYCTGASALELMIDLAGETERYDYFHSEDPMQAAGFVVSEAVTALWSTVRDREGFPAFTTLAAGQLIRWEAPYGWIRRGEGSVADKESSLAEVLAGMLVAPDHWDTFAAAYLDALDQLPETVAARTQPTGGRIDRIRTDRARALAQWHGMLLDRLADSESEPLLDRLVAHPALGGSELDFIAAQLATRRGERDRARELIYGCLEQLPGHEGFWQFAHQIEAPLPAVARDVAARRGWD
jgi:hypothetical protein